jgi:TPR repeat protein
MADRPQRYPSYDPDIESYEERPASHPIAPYQVGPSVRTNYPERSVPLFLSDRDGEPDPSEYMPAVPQKRGSYTLRVLASVSACAAAGLLAALVSSDSAREVMASAKASTSAVLSAASAAVQPITTQPKSSAKVPDVPPVPPKESARFMGPEIQAPGPRTVAVAAVAPTREDIKTAYQSALQGNAPQTTIAPESATPPDAIHHLDANEVAALLKRGDGLIASGDVAAARLVLRRAAEAGDARAAMTLGGTYDPTVLERLGVHGVVPDLSMARTWYEKARRFGAPEAASQLELLANRQR